MRIALAGGAVLVGGMVAALIAWGDDLPSSAPPGGMSLRLELFVADLEKSAQFYEQVLGFARLPGQKGYLPVRAGSVVIGLGPAAQLPPGHYFNPQLQTGRRGLGTEIVLEVDDVRAAYQQARKSGYERILTGLVPRPWGATDFRLADPDGYYLRVTSR